MAQHAHQVSRSMRMEGDRNGAWPMLSISSSSARYGNDHQELASAAADAFRDKSPDDPRKPSSGMSSRLLPARSMRSTTGAGDDGEVAAAAPVAGARSLSFSKLFSFRIAAAAHSSSSLDFDHQLPADSASSDHISANNDTTAMKTKTMAKQASDHMNISRSQSVPMSTLSRFSSKGGGGSKRVADSSSLRIPDGGSVRFRVSVIGATTDGNADTAGEEEDDAGSVEAEEEALVCRICMVALSEDGGGGGGGTLKLECRCKGELALAHGDCAVKWFSIKGNATCDVCNHEVLNLPVTLRRVHDRQQLVQEAAAAAAAAAAASGDDIAGGNQRGGYSYGHVWRGTTILVIVSMLAYFCFLEQLLVGDHGTAALAISLPFACVLGLFSSLTTTKMVSRKYVWIYSAVQYLFIVLFTHLFYRYVRLQAVIAIILSTFAGFGVAICANAILLQIIRWRARRASTSASQEEEEAGRAPTQADLENGLPPPP
uniref:RING-CH-type domain-containing protein n=1 Tax=Oryza punctata TaxID=4537 RepID=A0A0E0LBB2_ORYPU